MQTVKLKTEGKYVDHSIKANKAVTLQFKMPYSELTNYVQSIQMLNENVKVAVKIGADKKPLQLGTFMVHNLNIDRDGEGKIKFNAMLDHCDANAINDLALRNDEPLHVLLKAEIDIEDDEDEELEDDE
jgi:hypothetical protein